MRSNALRMLVAALFAIPVAFGLFMIMNKLIDRDFENPDIKSRKVAEIVRPDEEIEVNVKQEKPEKVEDPEQPPPELQPLEFDVDMLLLIICSYDGCAPCSHYLLPTIISD